MKVRTLLTLVAFSALVLLGFQLASPVSRVFAISAIVDIKPDTLNLKREGKWITVYIELSNGYNVSDIDTSTILLKSSFDTRVLRPDWSRIENDVLIVKFRGQDVIDYVWSVLYHMGGRTHIELMLEGQLTDGTNFSGKDTVTVINPPDAPN